MHELVIIEGILNAVIPEVEKHNVNKVLSIRLKIGEMAGLVPVCLEDYFQAASKGTIAEGAKLEIEKIPVAIHCNDCGYEGGMKSEEKDGPRELDFYRCPECGSAAFKITAGREYFVDSVEAE